MRSKRVERQGVAARDLKKQEGIGPEDLLLNLERNALSLSVLTPGKAKARGDLTADSLTTRIPENLMFHLSLAYRDPASSENL